MLKKPTSAEKVQVQAKVEAYLNARSEEKKRVEDRILHPLELTTAKTLLALAEAPLVVDDRPGF